MIWLLLSMPRVVCEARWPWLMVSVMDSGLSGFGSSPGQGDCVVFLALSLSTQVYKWVPVTLMLRGNPAGNEKNWNSNLPIGQVSMKSHLPRRKNYLSRTTGRGFWWALPWDRLHVASHPGGSGNTSSCFMLLKPGKAPAWWTTRLVCRLCWLTLKIVTYKNAHANKLHLWVPVKEKYIMTLYHKTIKYKAVSQNSPFLLLSPFS